MMKRTREDEPRPPRLHLSTAITIACLILSHRTDKEYRTTER